MMPDLAQLDLRAKGGEARVRALLEDLIDYYKGVHAGVQLALAVWFGKAPESQDQHLLMLFTGSRLNRIIPSERQSLLWKTGQDQPPFVNIHATSVDDFSQLLASNSDVLRQYRDKTEVLYFEKRVLAPEILREFEVITEPSGLVKGWYLNAEEYGEVKGRRRSLASYQQGEPQFGIVKTWESPDFQTCRGLLHVEISQKWLPLSPPGIQSYEYYRDSQQGNPGHLILEGGSLYRIIKFEVITSAEYSARVLEKLRDDRYPEVYLRAVYPPEQSAA